MVCLLRKYLVTRGWEGMKWCAVGESGVGKNEWKMGFWCVGGLCLCVVPIA